MRRAPGGKMPGNTHRCWLVDKLHVPMRWITTSKEVPSGEKRVSRLRNHIGTDGSSRQQFFFQCWQANLNEFDTHVRLHYVEIGLRGIRVGGRRTG
jgi:hypothetical protein